MMRNADLFQHESAVAAYLKARHATSHAAHACPATTPAAHADWAANARPALRRLIGLERMEEEMASFEPSVVLGEAEELADCIRRPGRIESEPGWDTPFWYVTPKGAGPWPLVLLPHGHTAWGMNQAVGLPTPGVDLECLLREDRDVAIQAAQHGFASIAPATRGFEPALIPDLNGRHAESGCRSQLMHALMVGRTTIGERVWDLLRLLDWGLALPEIDASRVMIMGNSGGGMATLYTAACETRIHLAIASCSYCSFLGENGLIHHCDCNMVPGIHRFGEAWDVAGLIAPRPFQVVHGLVDPLFPREEITRTVSALALIYAATDAAPAFDHALGAAGHRFYKELMWPFIHRHV